ncbi:MAG: hypothetical protein ACOC5T_00515 [Elusimicrobiota bacterium]
MKCPVCDGTGKVFIANPEEELGWDVCPHCNDGEISKEDIEAECSYCNGEEE